MLKAFNYIFKDNNLVQKSLWYFIWITLFMFVTCDFVSLSKNILHLFLLLTITIIIESVISGYQIAIIKSLDNNSNFNLIPYFNLKKNFILGIKFLASTFMFNFIFYILLSIPCFILGILAYTISKTWTACLITIIALTVIAYLLYFIVFLPAYKLYFSRTDDMFSIFDLKEIFSLISGNYNNYKRILLYFIILLFINILFKYVLNTSDIDLILFVFNLLITSAFTFYFSFASTYLISKFDKNFD